MMLWIYNSCPSLDSPPLTPFTSPGHQLYHQDSQLCKLCNVCQGWGKHLGHLTPQIKEISSLPKPTYEQYFPNVTKDIFNMASLNPH